MSVRMGTMKRQEKINTENDVESKEPLFTVGGL